MTSSSKMERSRYILVYYSYERILKEEEIRRIFTSQLQRIYGLQGSLEMGLFVSWVHEHEPLLILRSSHRNVMKLNCLTFFITDYNQKSLTLLPLRTSGSIKKSKAIALSPNWKELIPKKENHMY